MLGNNCISVTKLIEGDEDSKQGELLYPQKFSNLVVTPNIEYVSLIIVGNYLYGQPQPHKHIRPMINLR